MEDSRKTKLLEAYDDAYFELLMDRVAEREGERALVRSEKLQSDPAAAIPKGLHKKCLRLIAQTFSDRQKQRAEAEAKERQVRRERRANFTWSLAGKVAITVILLAAVATVSFAASDGLRTNVMNAVLDIRNTCTVFFFGQRQLEENDLEISVGWIPEGFELVDETDMFSYTRTTYRNDTNGVILVEKSHPIEISVDTEGAVVSDVMVDGCPATLVKKEGEVYILWVSGEGTTVWYITAENVPLEDVLMVAESVY